MAPGLIGFAAARLCQPSDTVQLTGLCGIPGDLW